MPNNLRRIHIQALAIAVILALVAFFLVATAPKADAEVIGTGDFVGDFTEMETFPSWNEGDEVRTPGYGCTQRKVEKGTQFQIVHAGSGTMRFEGKAYTTIFYDHCAYNDQITYVAYRLKIIDYVDSNDGFGEACGWFSKANINVAPVTGYDPPFKSFECSASWRRGDLIVKKDYPTAAEGQIGHVATDRCASTSVKVWAQATPDQQVLSWTSSQGCLG